MYSDKCLFWEHGTLLQPQHLQITSIQSAAWPALLANALCPYAWGVRRLAFREEALLLQSVEVHSLDVVLPTGEHLLFGNNTSLGARRFDDAWTNPEAPLEVWLGLAPLNPSGDNVSECNMQPTSVVGIGTRFVAPFSPEQVPDLYSTGPQADVRFMQYNARLVFGTEKELLESMTVIPLALLERDGDTVRFAPYYAPPCMDIHASPVLLEHLRGIRNSVVARSIHLADYKLLPDLAIGNPAAQADTPVTTQALTMYIMHGVLARYAPLLEHLCEAPALHPWPVYAVLRQLAGELSIFSSDLSPLGETSRGEKVLPAYTHTNLGPTFATVRLIVSRIVDSLVMGPAYTFPLEPRGDHWGVHLPGHACGNAYRYVLLVRCAKSTLSSDLLARRAKLAPLGLLQSLVNKSLPGVRLLPLEQIPSGLTKRADTLYFAMDQTDSLWESIMGTGDLALFLPDVDENTSIQLALLQR